jgi:hypothetical protein
VGRRDSSGVLRALTPEEITPSEHPLINIALEAGFDLETVDGKSISEILATVKMSDWTAFKIDRDLVRKARLQGQERFRQATRKYVSELEKLVPKTARVHFAHLMAGGVPRARIFMPVMNRVFKGLGERHFPSHDFWKSDLGWLCSESFSAVTSDTFRVLCEETELFRKARGEKRVSYSAYGYHGTEILIDGRYQWQSYAPYLQGWAKMELENIAKEYFAKGWLTTVSNCPEILTNSSSIFQGVEVPLYPLLKAIEFEATKINSSKARDAFRKISQTCQDLLKPGETVPDLLKLCDSTITNPSVSAQSKFETWPQHNTQEQMQVLLTASDQVFDKHSDSKKLMTAPLSEIVLSACGAAVLSLAESPVGPVVWINHDFVAKHFLSEPKS